ncbi:MAG: Crp/Fnr family transcriptional regulator [Flavobacteriales bacterium]
MKELIIKELLTLNNSLTSKEIDLGLSYFQEKEFKANELISKSGEVCEHLFFANNSITRCFYLDSEGEEQTLWMKPEQSFITDYKSFVNQNESQFSLQFYENTKVMMIARKDLLHLYKTSMNWALFGVNLTESVHINLIDVFVNLLANDATRNYQYIEYMFPKFIQVAPLKDIASMLQITPVSLSRIRAGKQLKK